MDNKIFTIYTSELFDVISQHLPTAHSYPDDTSIYLAFNPNDDSDQDVAIAAMEACLCDMRSWMINDKLMINDSKTEFMLIGTKAQLQKTKSATLTFGESILSPSTEPLACFDWRSAFFHLHNIRRVRKYLSIESAEKLVHAFITSRLDYCNSLYTDYPTAPSLNCSVFKTQLQEFYI